EADPERPGLEVVPRLVLLERESALDQVLVAPGAHDLAKHLGGAWWGVQRGTGRLAGPGPARDGDGLLAGRVCERVAKGDQIEEVIGVQVTQEDRIDIDVVDVTTKLGEHPVAAVEHERVAVLLDQVAAAGAVGIL